MKKNFPSFTFWVFGLVLVLLAALAVLLIPAWLLVDNLTHPDCTPPTQLAGFTTPQEHWLPTADGLSIRVWYYPSQNGANLLTFGGLDGALGDRMPPAYLLLQAGYGVVQLDTRACAQPAAPVTLGGNEILEAQAALDFLLAQPGVDREQIGVYGFSLGGATALRLAAQRTEIRAVVRDGGYANLGELLHPSGLTSIPLQIHYSAVETFFRLQTGLDPWQVNPLTDIASLSPRPVLLIYGEAEAVHGERQYQAASEPKVLWIVPDGHHGANHLVAPAEYQQRLLDFLAQTLLP